MSRLLAFFMLLLPLVSAVYKDEAFVTDWHRPSIGRSIVARDIGPYGYVGVSNNGILSHVAAENDTIVWRHELHDEHVMAVYATADIVAVVSSREVTFWNTSTGYFLRAAQIASGNASCAALAATSLYVADSHGKLYEFDMENVVKSPLVVDLGQGLQECAISSDSHGVYTLDRNSVYVVDKLGNVDLVDLSSYNKKIKQVLRLHDGKVFYVDSSKQIAVLTLHSLKTITTDYTAESFDLLDLNSLIKVNTEIYATPDAEKAVTVDGNTVVAISKHSVTVLDSEFGIKLASFPYEISKECVVSEYKFVGDHLYSSCESNGEVSFFVDGSKQWERDESVSEVLFYAVYDAQKQEAHSMKNETVFDAFKSRWSRHFKEFDQMVSQFQWRFSSEMTEEKKKDFGWTQKLILVTSNKKIMSLELDSGTENWKFDQVSKMVKDKTVSVIGLQIESETVVVEFTNDHVLVLDANSGKMMRYGPKKQSVSLSMPQYDVVIDGNAIQGFQKGEKTWSFVLKDAKILASASYEPNPLSAAPIGVILGDRSVLYKYLYPYLFAIATVDNERLLITILDSATGKVIRTLSHDASSINIGTFQMVMGEYFIIYSFNSYKPTYSTKIHVIELYESNEPDKKTWSGLKGNVTVFDHKFQPHIKTKAYDFPFVVEKLALTKTRFDVSTRNLVLKLENGQILMVPKFLVSSRRVEGRPLTDIEKAEYMMMPYDSNLGINSNAVISHLREIVGGSNASHEHLFSVPTRLESTAYVCYLANDVFCTKVYPSLQFDVLSSAFSKRKLVATIVGLLGVYFVTWRLVERKKLTSFWVDRY